MKLSDWPTGDYPVLVDPTHVELQQLINSQWDTLRGFIVHDAGKWVLCVASGYGNTHDSINKQVAKVIDVKRAPCEGEFILYKSSKGLMVNYTTEGIVTLNRALREESNETLQQFFLAVKISQ